MPRKDPLETNDLKPRRPIPAAFGTDEVFWAAWLYYEQGQKQDQIADQLGISRASVFNLLQKARDEGVVNISIDPSRIARADLSLRLCELYGIDECFILPERKDAGALHRQIGHLGARVLESRMSSDDIIGVAWGRTVLALSQHLNTVNQPNVTIAQITGSSAATFDFSPVLCTSNLAARLLARCVNLHAPGVVSSPHVKEILMAEPAICEHFALLEHCSKAVFGVTQLTGETLLVTGGFMSQAEVEVYRDLGAVGFASGYFFAEDGRIIRSEFDDRHITMPLDNLRAVPERICVGGGPGKAVAIRGMLRAGIASVLVTDAATARDVVNGG
ncbi:sugar-binding transcriptional regulator [Pseudotabrizicola alkalilacus]|uniref:Sugar-binding transcriptional regulator n=1 Tax=Pseudotabrizicola alkalilacus TaxID=2305252 RepID=A0A411YWA7_9RHOB|nr:sugar-binding transcriptional regulator [Pseudotabrizicola alkalilacus]RGP35171.1 sugar-binding transcriptional regulator [Pseudotabrizicola alkalilacus]